MKKNYIIICIILLGFTHGAFANSSLEQKLENSYNKYSYKIGLEGEDRKIFILNRLGNKLDQILETKELSLEKESLLKFLGKINNDKILETTLSKEEKYFKSIYNRNTSNSIFDKQITNQHSIFLENGVWYFYRYNKWSSFPKNNYRTLDLKANKFTNENTVISIQDGKTIFITQYEKIRLINDDIIAGVKEKYEFLKEIKDDKRFLSGSTDPYFIQLRRDTLELIGDERDTQKKIQKIYNFVLSNVSYTQNLDLEDKKIFSGILSYKNRDGVCEGYSKLMVYMLGFAGIGDYEAIRGFVIDAPDFPQIGHAWVRIGDKYYDPTFDDPIGIKTTRKPQEYLYYNLPQDLFYSNRYHYEDLPDHVRNASIEDRNNFIQQRLTGLVSKYDENNYLVLKPFAFKKSLGLKYNEDITINDLQEAMDSYEIVNGRPMQNGNPASLNKSNFAYYKITSNNIPTILKQINYEIEEYFIIKLEDGSFGVAY